jgi:hypothetical protein
MFYFTSCNGNGLAINSFSFMMMPAYVFIYRNPFEDQSGISMAAQPIRTDRISIDGGSAIRTDRISIDGRSVYMG